jgi:hypothetical protein
MTDPVHLQGMYPHGIPMLIVLLAGSLKLHQVLAPL